MLKLGDLVEGEFFLFKDEIGKVKAPVLQVYAIEVTPEPVGSLGCRFYYTKRLRTPDRRVRSGDQLDREVIRLVQDSLTKLFSQDPNQEPLPRPATEADPPACEGRGYADERGDK